MGDPTDTDSTAGGAAARVDLRTLSRLVGLSMVTVSRALNNRPGVKAATRQRVLAAAREHGYAPSAAARLLRARPSLVAGLVFAPYYGPSREINPHALALVERLRAALRLRGVDMRVLYFEGDEALRGQILEANVLVFYGSFRESAFAIAAESGIPALLFDKRSGQPGQISVLVDAAQSCARAVEYLAALGHERVGLVTGPAEELYYNEYARAFPGALRELNLPARPEWVFQLPAAACNQDGARAALLPLLRRPNPAERPSAIVFASDWLALGGRRAALDAGLSLPADLSIIGHDNLPSGAEIEPALTTFDVHAGRVVQTLTHFAVLLGSRRDGAPAPGAAREVLIPADFIKRASCACLRPAP
ncbi:MAG: LacI family transcriptional regulator [Opitutaceae bacterium]|jgi:LacI family transcriptional regulator|nr:LacI family transcriptional regulator [Opitutaceae bacterium]